MSEQHDKEPICKQCEEKDREIESLLDTINNLEMEGYGEDI